MDALTAAFTSHPRRFESFRWAYPVLSRRSGGISLGVNLNPDRACNFGCLYCQVDRRGTAPSGDVDPSGVEAEVGELLGRVAATGLAEAFPGVAAQDRRLSDIALSGDGEPTMRREFPDVCLRLGRLRARWIEAGGDAFRLVLITNATLLDSPTVVGGLDHLHGAGGLEVWAKLDAGTDGFYRKVNESRVPFPRILANIEACSRRYPTRIQTLFFEKDGVIPSDEEVAAWIEVVAGIHAKAPLAGVQLHTVARATAVAGCRPVPEPWLRAVAGRLHARAGLSAEVHGGVDSGSFAER